MKRTKFLILFLFYTSVLLIKGKLREPDEFVMYDERIGNENSRCLWDKVCRYDLQFGILVCQLKCMNSHLEVCRYFAGKSQNLKIANYFVLEEYAENFVTSMLEKDVPFRCYS